ncbi:MAG: RsmB/NOP family class I SAM-dependent RNA methyltransferase, partial [Sphingobacteriaceae bacterium]
MGSRDRKNLSKAIYSYFRLGNCLAGLKSDERLFVALFLTANSPDDMLAYFKPDYQERIADSLDEKAACLASLFPEFNLNDIFPFASHLSASIDQSLFINSLLIQPDLFIRVIKGAEQKLADYLNEAQIP